MKFRVMVTCCPDCEDCAACVGCAAGAAWLVAGGGVAPDGAGAEHAATRADRPSTSETAPRLARVVETFTSAPLGHRFLAAYPRHNTHGKSIVLMLAIGDLMQGWASGGLRGRR